MMDKLFQLKVSCSKGVCPRGAQVRTRVGRVLSPLSSTNTIWRPCRSAFFYRGPLHPPPLSDGFLVSFDRAAFGPLTTETQGPEKSPDMSGVVLHSGQVFDEAGHP